MNNEIVEIDGIVLKTIGDVMDFIRKNYGGSIKRKDDLLKHIKDRSPVGLSLELLDDIIKISISKNRLDKIDNILDELE
jgi:ABC-type microcin C transport system permease subunit YejB